ncbi:MAG: hypothetical protein WBC70_04455 [Candidatus Aminicenantales bacterium]
MINSIIILRMKGKSFFFFLFLVFSLLISLYLLLVQQVPRFTFTNRAFRPSPLAVIFITSVVFVLLLAVWILTSRLSSRLFARKEPDVLGQDFLTFLPLLFLSLAPLTLHHYTGAADLLTRLRLLALGIAGAFVYLKIVQARRWGQTTVLFWRSWSRRFTALSLKKRTALLFLVSLLAFNAGSFLQISRGVTFSGDEPHYLLISHSLLRDGDFDLANNYERRDYGGFMMFEGEIGAHVVRGAKPGNLYSFHSPGVAFLMLPFYALNGLIKGKALVFLLRLGMSLWGAFFSIQVYLYARSEWRKDNLAQWLWFLTSFTTPVFFYSVHVYPEIVVAALSLAVFRLLRFSAALDAWKAVVCGLGLASFFWFHALKYLALFIPLFFYAFWTLAKRSKSRLSPALLTLVTAAGIFLYLRFQHALYGSYSPATVSWAAPMTDSGEKFLRFLKDLLFQIPWRDRWQTFTGYFLDQRDGLFFYAPIFFFSLFGAIEMFRQKRREFFLLLWLTAPYVLVSAFLTQRTGYAPQARPLVAVIWALAVGVGYFMIRNRGTILSNIFNLAAGLSFLFGVILCLTPLNLYQETTRGPTERGAGLFYLLSNLHFQITDFLPSYIKSGEGLWLPNIIWPGIVVFLIILYVVTTRRPLLLPFSSHLFASCAAVLIFFFLLVLYPRLALRNPTFTELGPGKKTTFYSLSRVARMVGPGRFRLREDGRSYRFFLTTRRPVEELRISLGSTQGDYEYAVSLFDEVLVQGKTVREVQSFSLPDPPCYKLGKESFYTIILELGKDTSVRPHLNPYHFEIAFD